MSQCPAIFPQYGGYGIVFCVRARNHDGDHRGSRKQWNQAGEKVAITMNEDGTPKKVKAK